MEAARSRTYQPSVRATMSFARREVDATQLTHDMKCLTALEDRTVTISDARPLLDDLSLTGNGFTLRRHTSALTDFHDKAVVRSRYIPELEEIVRGATGAKAVVVTDCVLRGSREMSDNNPKTRIYEYAFKAHADGNGSGFFRNAKALKPDVVSKYENCAFAEFNVWRPTAPVEEKPLALCDASTVSPRDLVPAYFDGWLDFPPEKRPDPLPQSGDYFHLAYTPAQRWYYFPDMTPDEVLIFKQWDSDRTKPLCVPHTAFEDPGTRPGARPRLSIEARCVAFFDRPQSDRFLTLEQLDA